MATIARSFPAARPARTPGWPALLTRLAERVGQMRRRDQIVRELEGHSDRLLADMGLTRDDIAAVARGAFRRGG